MTQTKKLPIKRAVVKKETARVQPAGQPEVMPQINITSVRPLDAPYFSAGSVAIQGTGNDFILLFGRPMPIFNMAGSINPTAMMNQPTVIVAVSPQTAKDIALALTESVAKHENIYGEITTPHTQKLAANVKRKQSH